MHTQALETLGHTMCRPSVPSQSPAAIAQPTFAVKLALDGNQTQPPHSLRGQQPELGQLRKRLALRSL